MIDLDYEDCEWMIKYEGSHYCKIYGEVRDNGFIKSVTFKQCYMDFEPERKCDHYISHDLYEKIEPSSVEKKNLNTY